MSAKKPSHELSIVVPLGMQIVGRAFDEPTVFRIGAAYERAAGWIDKRPSMELPIAV
jgi:aspartyl-tRNA(Asn)/glutamyl-tRNA(Gln) amidotransferase subunit A